MKLSLSYMKIKDVIDILKYADEIDICYHSEPVAKLSKTIRGEPEYQITGSQLIRLSKKSLVKMLQDYGTLTVVSGTIRPKAIGYVSKI